MKTFSQHIPAAHMTPAGFLQQIMLWISAAADERRARRRKRATAELLARMDEHLLDDIGATRPKTTSALEELAQMNPAYLAATAFTLPRKDRR
jgi:uncharacterized protein YjiS (DUF1127 family)